MRHSARVASSGAPAVSLAQAPVSQEPLRFGIGLASLVFWLWIVHSYKLNLGDLAVAGLGLGVVIRGGKLRVPGPLIAFAIYILWSSVGLLVSASNPVTIKALIDISKVWIIAFFVVNLVRNPAELRFVIIAWLGIFALYPIRGALYNQYLCTGCSEGGRIAWNFIFRNPNDLAAFCLIPLGLAAAVGVAERVKFWRLCGLVGVAVVALVIMLSQSRGAMLAIGVGTLLLVMTSQRRGRDLALLTVLIGFAAILAPKGVWERLAGLANVSVESGMEGVDPEGSAEARWQIWGVAYETILKNPLLGVGAGTMPLVHAGEAQRQELSLYIRGPRDTHSTYLRVAAETGIPGLMLYLSIWGSLLWYIRLVRRKLKHVRPREYQALVFIEVSLLAYLIASVFGTYGAMSFTYFGIAVAWLSASILADAPWYVPPGAVPVPGHSMAPVGVMRRGAR
jgi:O-antigen ligase